MHHNQQRAVIYTRICQEHHSSINLSQQEQTDYCKAWAMDQELEIIQEHHDYGPSGLEHRRPALTELLQYVATEAGIYVLVSSEDRLARNPLIRANIQQALHWMGARLIVVDREVNTLSLK